MKMVGAKRRQYSMSERSVSCYVSLCAEVRLSGQTLELEFVVTLY